MFGYWTPQVDFFLPNPTHGACDEHKMSFSWQNNGVACPFQYISTENWKKASKWAVSLIDTFH